MTTLRVSLHVAAQCDYELHSLDLRTAFLQGSLHEEIWLRRPPGFPDYLPVGSQWSLRRPVYGLRQAPREWHDTLRTTLAALGFAPATADPSLFLRTDTSLLPFYVLVYIDDLVFATADTEALTLLKSELHKRHTCTDLGELRSYLGLQITRDRARRTITLTQSHMVHPVLQRFGFHFSSPQRTLLSISHSLSAPPLDESVEPSGPYPELVGCLMHLMTTSGMGLVLGGRGPVVLTGHADASWVDDSATQRSSWGYTFSLGSGSDSWWSTRSSSVLSSSCEAEIYAGAMAAQELRWLTYLLTDLGEQPRSPPVLYVDNKAMIALCQEHRLEHRTKHIALRYFLARELQQRGQLRLAYVATRANTADLFAKALPPGDHQCFVTVLALFFFTGLVTTSTGNYIYILTLSTADSSLFLRTDTSLPPFYVLVYVDDLVFAIADIGALALVESELHKRHTCTDLGSSELQFPVLLATVYSSAYRSVALSSTFGRVRLVFGGRGPVVLTGHAYAYWVDGLATQRSSQGYTFSLGFGSVSWRSTRSSSVLSSSCEAEIYAGAMAA
ncbi:unnamed protein product [Closterium sp. NIES-53]